MEELYKWLWIVPTVLWVFTFTWFLIWKSKFKIFTEGKSFYCLSCGAPLSEGILILPDEEEVLNEEDLPDNVIPFPKNRGLEDDGGDDDEYV